MRMFLMTPSARRLSKYFITIIACESFLLVQLLVYPPQSLRRKCRITKGTPKRSFQCMPRPYMISQLVGLIETVAALVAHMILLSLVHTAYMRDNSAAAGESFATDFANKWPFAGVHAHMYLQIGRMFELLAARLTFEVSGVAVAEHVTQHIAIRTERFVAYLTVQWLRHMLFQVIDDELTRHIRFAANVTFESLSCLFRRLFVE